MDIAIDEWVVYHIGNPEKREAVEAFLKKVYRKCDRFVTIRGGGLDQRISQMAKECANWEPLPKGLAKWFIAKFRVDSRKFHVLEESEALPLPRELERQTPRKDAFLVRTALTTGPAILTTDGRLKKRLAHREDVEIHMLDDFLREYDP